MKRLFSVIVIGVLCIVAGLQGFTMADEAVIDFGVVHYSDAPMTWIVDVPDNIISVEVGLYGSGQTQVNKYGGWNGYMKLNGSYIWRMLGLDSSGVARIEDSTLGQTVSEISGRRAWMDITSLVKPGENTLTYYHYTGGSGVGVKVKMATSASTLTSVNTENQDVDDVSSDMKLTGYSIDIHSVDLGYFETVFTGSVTQNGTPVANVQVGVEDPLMLMSLMGPTTNGNGQFTYRTLPYENYRSADEFLFAFGDAVEPYIIAQRFMSYDRKVYNLEDNDVYISLSELRKENVQVYQQISNGMVPEGTLSVYNLNQAKQDVVDIMIDSSLSEVVSSGMDIADWAGSVGMCAKGVLATGVSSGVSAAGCAPLGVKLVNEGVDISTDILVDNGYLSGSAANFIDEASATATSCISITDPIDTASCLSAVASGGLHVISYELENNDYGQSAVVVKLSKRVSGTVDYALVIIDTFN